MQQNTGTPSNHLISKIEQKIINSKVIFKVNLSNLQNHWVSDFLILK